MGHIVTRKPKATFIDLTLENCEYVKIPIEHVEYLSIRCITQTIAINAFQYIDGTDSSYEYAEDIDLRLVDLDHLPFTQFTENMINDETSLVDRIMKHPDITHIRIEYEDGSEKRIVCPWESFEINVMDTNNKWQKSEIVEDYHSKRFRGSDGSSTESMLSICIGKHVMNKEI